MNYELYHLGKSLFFSCFLTVLGEFIFAYSCTIWKYYLILIGRGIFGLGINWFGIVEGPLINSYFKGKNLGLAWAIKYVL